MVNRVWHHHFCTGIVATPGDFGIMGSRPTHPELLDWLTDDFVRNGWSLKRLHRLIMTSSTYRQISSNREQARVADPSNQLLWRFPPQRLEVEAVRDSALAVAGLLNTAVGGRSVFPPLPAGMPKPVGGWDLARDVSEHNRRSVYIFVRRNDPYPMLSAIDFPDSHDSCSRRNRTTTAPQALTLLNGKLTAEWARHFAGRVLDQAAGDPARLVEAAYSLAYSRLPDPWEKDTAQTFLARQADIIAAQAAAGSAAPVPDVAAAAGDAPSRARAAALVGLGALALSHLLGDSGVLPRASGAAADKQPLASKRPHHPPKAKSVTWLFMEGGPSHIDLFDPKPALEKLAGERTPESFKLPVTSATGSHRMPLVPSQRKWKQHGGRLESRRFRPADEYRVDPGGRPSLGAWTTYGLGAANQNLPAFVVLTDDKVVRGGPTNWSSEFLPATYQGTHLQKDGPPILDLLPPGHVSDRQQRSRLDLLQALNRHHSGQWPSEDELDARMESYELAYRMQGAAPEIVDLAKESEATRKLYGMDDKVTAKFGGNCLLARRLVENGVRFGEVYCGSGSGWDAHSQLEENHSKWCAVSDKPVAGSLADLKSRGLLESTLVVWGGEFGRTPFTDTNSTGLNPEKYGRDHNPWGFTMWMAGGGVKGGQAIGTTDEIGFRAVDKPYHVHDIHATVLHLLGLNHLNLTFLHNGRPERATVNSGTLIAEALA
ncbi:MAG: DUF1501 domain-containing protein [Bryobacterales bacterium]|nr:DUF1501 domain-containing protein [Bryobacterales bacterium]